VIAVLGGLVAACMFATATLCSSRSSRMIGAGPLLAWVMLVGLLITAPIAIAGGVPDELDAEALVWLAMSGAGNVLGLLLAYRGLRVGRVGVVAAIVSTEGAVAAVISVVAGEEVRTGAAVALAVIVIGIILAAASRSEGEASVGPWDRERCTACWQRSPSAPASTPRRASAIGCRWCGRCFRRARWGSSRWRSRSPSPRGSG
jgi:drug/metabolite transporter (DMT)-like permease